MVSIAFKSCLQKIKIITLLLSWWRVKRYISSNFMAKSDLFQFSHWKMFVNWTLIFEMNLIKNYSYIILDQFLMKRNHIEFPVWSKKKILYLYQFCYDTIYVLRNIVKNISLVIHYHSSDYNHSLIEGTYRSTYY